MASPVKLTRRQRKARVRAIVNRMVALSQARAKRIVQSTRPAQGGHPKEN